MTSITAERDLYERVGFTHRRREQWGSVGTWRNDQGQVVSYLTARPVDEPATRLFAHISVTNPSSYPSNDAHARAIEAIGISRFSNTGISYNELILPGGRPYEGQPMGRRGAHTVNDEQRSTCSTSGCPSQGSPLTAPSWNLNINARACCFARNVDDPVTDADIDAAARWAAAGKLTGMVAGDARWHGHRCVSSKDCPGGRVWARMSDLDDLTADYVRRGNVALEDNMELSDTVKTDSWAIGKRVFGADASLRGILVYAGAYGQQAYVAAQAIRAEQTKARLRDEAILLAVEGVNEEAILARIDEVAAEAAKAAEADAARDAAILQLLQEHATGLLDAEEVVRRIGELLVAGSTPTP